MMRPSPVRHFAPRNTGHGPDTRRSVCGLLCRREDAASMIANVTCGLCLEVERATERRGLCVAAEARYDSSNDLREDGSR